MAETPRLGYSINQVVGPGIPNLPLPLSQSHSGKIYKGKERKGKTFQVSVLVVFQTVTPQGTNGNLLSHINSCCMVSLKTLPEWGNWVVMF